MKMSIRYHIWSILKILGWKVQSICGCYTDNPIMAASTVHDTKEHKVDARNSQTAITEKTKKIPEEGIKATKSVRFETNDHGAGAAEATSDHKLPYDTIHLKVAMHCEGCKQKVVKVLSKMDEVRQIDISMKRQKVDVSGFIDPKKVIEAIQKTGKKVELWLEDGAVSVDVQSQGESDARKSLDPVETLQDPSSSSVANELKGNGGTEKAGMQEEHEAADAPTSSCKQSPRQTQEEIQASPTPSDPHSSSPSHLDCTLPKEQECENKSEKSAKKKQFCEEDVPSQAVTNLPHQSAEPQEEEDSKSSHEPQEKEKGNEILEVPCETTRTSPSLEESQQALRQTEGGTFGINRDTFTSSLISSAEEFFQELLTGRLMNASGAYKPSPRRKPEAGYNEIYDQTAGNDFKPHGFDHSKIAHDSPRIKEAKAKVDLDQGKASRSCGAVEHSCTSSACNQTDTVAKTCCTGTDRGDHVAGTKHTKPSSSPATGVDAFSKASKGANSARDRDCSRKDSQHLRGEFDSEKARAPQSEKLLSSIADVFILLRGDNPPRTPNYNDSSARQLDHRSSKTADRKTVQRAKTTDHNHAGKMPARRKDASCQTISSQTSP